MKKKHSPKFWLILGVAIFLFGITGLFAQPPAGVVVMLIGAALTIPYFRRKGKAPVQNHPTPAQQVHVPPLTQKPVVSASKPPIKTPIEASPSQPHYITENHRVAGVAYYQQAILSLAVETDEYTYTKKELEENSLEDEKIWKYEFYPSKVELIEEPDNPHDPKAIKVVIDDEHVGYIKSGSCSHVKNLLKSGRIHDVTADIMGGPYKLLYYDDYEDKYELEKDETSLHIDLHIRLNPQ